MIEVMGMGRSVKGSRACGAMKSTLSWFLFQLVTPQKAIHTWVKDCSKQIMSMIRRSGCQVGECQHYYAHRSFDLLVPGWYNCVNYVFS